MTMRLTDEQVRELRRPYHVNAVKWLPIGKITSGVNMMPHIDASLVIERLSDVDPGWSEDTRPVLLGADVADPMGLKHQSPWRCELTVGGVTRVGYGQLDAMSAQVDGKHIKAGESDALKRAALKFGVGAYLRAIPMTWLPKQVGGKDAVKVNQSGKFNGLTPVGKQHLRAAYEKIVQHAAFVEHYGTMIDYGDMQDDGEDIAVVAEEPAAASNEAAVDVLVMLARFTGRDTPEAQVRATAAATPFKKLLPGAVTGVKQNLGASIEDAERLRVDAIAASEGDDAAMLRLSDGLETLAAQADEAQETMPV